MQNRDTNRLNMIRTTILWCTNNASATATIPAFAAVKATVETKLSIIDQLNQKATTKNPQYTRVFANPLIQKDYFLMTFDSKQQQ